MDHIHDVQEQGQGLIYFVNLKGEKAGKYNFGNYRYNLIDDDQMAILGDFWKVLRVRPSPTGFKAQWPTFEYLPNNTLRIRITKSKRL
jgi:hypothetical protein